MGLAEFFMNNTSGSNFWSNPNNALKAVAPMSNQGAKMGLTNIYSQMNPAGQNTVMNALGGGYSSGGGLAKMLGNVNTFMNSGAGKGAMGLAGLAGGLFDAYTGYQSYRQNKKNMQLERDIASYNLNRQRQENNRLDRQRADITNKWSNGKVI